jgi:hypothetical protein
MRQWAPAAIIQYRLGVKNNRQRPWNGYSRKEAAIRATAIGSPQSTAVSACRITSHHNPAAAHTMAGMALRRGSSGP